MLRKLSDPQETNEEHFPKLDVAASARTSEPLTLFSPIADEKSPPRH